MSSQWEAPLSPEHVTLCSEINRVKGPPKGTVFTDADAVILFIVSHFKLRQCLMTVQSLAERREFEYFVITGYGVTEANPGFLLRIKCRNDVIED